MANATITVLEADGVTQTDVIVLDVGRQAAAASKSVAASTEDKAVLDAIAASLAALDNAVGGNELQVDVLTLPAIPAGNNNIGDVDIASIAAGDNNIGNVDIASIAAGDNNIGNVDIASIAAGTNNIGDVDVLTLGGQTPAFGAGVTGSTVLRVDVASDGALISAIAGNVAHDAADSGNGSKIAAKAETSPKGITLVSDGDRTDLYADADGLLMVKLNTSAADQISEATSTTGSSATAFTNFSAVASTRNYVTAIDVFRTDSGTTMQYVDIKDGTAGNVLWRMPLPPGSGSMKSTTTPFIKTTANTALAFQVSSALSTVYINVAGYQSKA